MTIFDARKRCFKRSIIPRLVTATGIGFGCVCFAPTASAQPQMSVDEAVRAALARPEVEARFRAQVERMHAEIDEETIHPAPRLELSHDQVFGDLNVGYQEFSASVGQNIDLSSWRGELRHTLSHREAALKAEVHTWQLEVATAVRLAFYQIRFHTERLAALDAWLTRLEESLAGLRAREERGDASTYQVRRIEREIELVRASRARVSSEKLEGWAELKRWTALQESPLLVGQLRPDAPSPSQPAETPMRPELKRLESLESALHAEARAWGAPMLRDWSVGGGYRFATVGPSVGHGLLVSLSLPLSVWNTDAPRLRGLRARQLALRNERALQTKLAAWEAEAAQERLTGALDALDTISDTRRDAALTSLAQVAFNAGEATLSELLDAFESETELQLARIALEWEARRAAIALDRSRGIGVPQ